MTTARSGRVRAAIVVTGDEVLDGRVRDENGPFLSAELRSAGCDVERMVFVGDMLERLVAVIRAPVDDGAAIVVVSGGLGPTADDRTMEAVASVAGVPLEWNDEAAALVRARIQQLRGRVKLSDDDFERTQRKQALVPAGATVLPPVGTAPGCVLRTGGACIVVLPGPPSELRPMWRAMRASGVMAATLADVGTGGERTLRLWWVTEAELIVAFDGLSRSVVDRIGTYTRHGELEVVVPADAADTVQDHLHARLGGALFSADGRHVDDIVAQALVARGESLAVAESCTGGALGARVVSRPGASAWFAGGVIAYSNAVKAGALDVDAAAIATEGAVSETVAAQMAQGVRTRTGATWGASITGVAGPEGGTEEKPVGTVWIGVAGPDGADAQHFHFLATERDVIQRRAVTAALHRLRLRLGR